MNLAITNVGRYRVLTGYHHDIFSAIEQRQLQRAMRLLFGLAEDYCLNFEGDVAALSEKYHEVIDVPNDQSADPSLFLQAFHRRSESQIGGVVTPQNASSCRFLGSARARRSPAQLRIPPVNSFQHISHLRR